MAYAKKYISASEIGDYVYCKRGWWLKFKSQLKETPVMREGTQQHVSISRSLVSHKKMVQVIGYLVVAALLFLIASFFLR